MWRGEILALKWEHVDLKQGITTVTDFKNWELRRIPINPVLTKELKSVKMMGEYVFTKSSGEPYKEIKNPLKKTLVKICIKNLTL